jgi:hypothetical protein
MFRFTNTDKMDPPAATMDNTTDTTNTNTPSWEMTDAPVIVDGKQTYENVNEDDDDDCDKRKHEDLQESAVFQETKQASTDRMPSLEPARFNIPPAVTVPGVSTVGMPESTTPDSPVSLPSIDLSVKASDMDCLSVTDVPDLYSPPTTPKTKRARIHVETVTDDEDMADDDEIAFGFEQPPSELFPDVVATTAAFAAASATAAAANPTVLPVPPQVVVYMEEPAVLPTDTTLTEAALVVNGPNKKRFRWNSWKGVFTILMSAVLVAAPFYCIPNKPASASMSQQHGSVLVPTVTPSPSSATVTAVDPVVLVILDVEPQPEEGEEKAPTDAVLAVVEEALPAALLMAEEIVQETLDLDLGILFNSNSTMLAKEELAPTEAVLDVAEEAPPAALLMAEEIIQETLDLDLGILFNSNSTMLAKEELAPTEAVVAVTPEAPPAALLATEEIVPESIPATEVIEPPPTKQESNDTISCWLVAVMMFLGMSLSSIARRTTRPAVDKDIKQEQELKGILNNHAELARFLGDTRLTKKAGRKCRSPAKFGPSSSKGNDDINNNLHNYAGFTMEELKIILDGFNGSKSGHKADLIHAVVQCYRGALSGFKNYQLQELLAVKGLSQSGKKQEMVDRLVEVGF